MYISLQITFLFVYHDIANKLN